jgi:hypothetical protein
MSDNAPNIHNVPSRKARATATDTLMGGLDFLPTTASVNCRPLVIFTA